VFDGREVTPPNTTQDWHDHDEQTRSGVGDRRPGDPPNLPRLQRQHPQRTIHLRDYFWSSLKQRFGHRIVLNGHPQQRLPNTLNVSFVGLVGADILMALKGVAASTGSACHAGRVELSPVLAAMSVPEEIGMGALRFSLGRFTTIEEIEDVVGQLGSLFAAS
jgi:cysteine desulfurase